MDSLVKSTKAHFRAHTLRYLAILVSAVVLFSVLTGIAYATHVVNIYDNGEVVRYYTTDSDLTAQEILKDQQIAISEDDVVIYNGFSEGDKTANLAIMRAFPITLTADGETTTLSIATGSVRDALEKAGITLSEDDVVTPSLSTGLVPDMEIVVQRVTYNTYTETTVIPYETEVTASAAMRTGRSTVTQQGADGMQEATFRETIVDGVVVDTEMINTIITQEAITHKVTEGTNDSLVSDLEAPASLVLDEDGIPTSYSRVLTGRATAYSSRRETPRGASGMALIQGHVAVDPNIIPYGTSLYITSTDGKYVYGYAIAADTGTALRTGHALVDCFFYSYEASCRFGAKQVNVYVLD